MFSKQVYKDQLQQAKYDFSVFVEKSGIEDIATQTIAALPERGQLFLANTIAKDGKLDDVLVNRMKEIALLLTSPSYEIPLHIDHAFRAGYSAACDIELKNDFDVEKVYHENSVGFSLKEPLSKPHELEHYNTKMGVMNMQFPHLIAQDLYGVLGSVTDYSLGNMHSIKHFNDSDLLADKLAGEVYKKDVTNELQYTHWCGDHVKLQGISGLANCFGRMIKQYVLGKPLHIGLYTTAQSDFVVRKSHERIKEYLEGLVSVELLHETTLQYSVEE